MKISALQKNSEYICYISQFIRSEKEMKTLKGGFDCGGGLNYYVGYCGNGLGFSVCSSNYLDFSEQPARLCKTQISN